MRPSVSRLAARWFPEQKCSGFIEASSHFVCLGCQKLCFRSRNAPASLKPVHGQERRCENSACFRSRNAPASLKRRRCRGCCSRASAGFRSRNAPASLKRSGQLGHLPPDVEFPEQKCSGFIEATMAERSKPDSSCFRSRNAPASLKGGHQDDYAGRQVGVSGAEMLRLR